MLIFSAPSFLAICMRHCVRSNPHWPAIGSASLVNSKRIDRNVDAFGERLPNGLRANEAIDT